MFADREEAGIELAEALEGHGDVDPDLVVAAPRGGMPLGRAVADALDVPLDIVTGKKLTAPGHSDLSIGAVSADGSVWLNSPMIEQRRVSDSYIEEEMKSAQSKAQDRQLSYREVKGPERVEGKHVVLVDDGLATGATVRACLLELRERGASQVTVAVPVADPRGIQPIIESVRHVFTLLKPDDFEAVSHYYDDFHQLDDQEAMSYLLF